MTKTVLTTDGRTVGDRGRQTRLLLLKNLVEELAATGYRGTTVMGVARRSKTSPAAFYHYFPDIDLAILALAQNVASAGSASCSAETESISPQDAPHRLTVAEAVQTFFALYEEHRVVLRVIDMKSAEGDQRFTELRRRFLRGLHADLSQAAQSAHPSAPAHAVASKVAPLVLMLAEVAAHDGELEEWSLDAEAVRTSAAELVHTAITT
ncbi:TetR family transcriptional regulator [Streptomyces niveus]|uniref:TetR family transcriptional regulator n=1 Tax=Streptomyces niveus TaxID=193462 RepID=UPI00365D2323